jgi:intracellular sulfur oxidation DsrE/DsrF family protein
MRKKNNPNAHQRRQFLGQLAAGGSAALGLSWLTTPAFAADSALNESVTAAEDWLSQLNGKHKMVFDVTQPHGIFPFAWPRVFLLTNQATGTPEKESNAVIVLRHNGIFYGMKDELWAKYKLGEAFGIDDHRTGKPATRNPFWNPNAGEFTVPGIGPVAIGINELQKSGVMFCVCDMAMTVNGYGIAAKMKLDGAEVKKDMVAGLLPGMQVVPSGIWAIGRTQEKGCAYCFAS